MLVNKVRQDKVNSEGGYLNIPLNVSFSPETKKEGNVEDMLGLKNEDIINPIVDYEKIKLIPVNFCENKYNNIQALKFNLHFFIDNNWTTGTTRFDSIGFNESDIKNRVSKLKKSFIRISFYDSNDLKSQNLLYYSIIYVNSDKLYTKYIEDNSMENIVAEFQINNPITNNEVSSFEGFHVYLFKEELDKIEEKTIYMKVEFSNSSNGRTILFTQKGSTPLKTNGYTMKELLDVMFIKTTCVFDSVSRKFVYYLTNKDSVVLNCDNNKVINIDLYQAKAI